MNAKILMCQEIGFVRSLSRSSVSDDLRLGLGGGFESRLRGMAAYRCSTFAICRLIN